MTELKLPRLLAAAKEFNVGQDTIIDFLVGKGFSHDDLKPTSKLTEAMYRSLQQEFQSDKVAKLKSDQIDLPKGTKSGLIEARQVLKRVKGVAFTQFNASDVVRHPLVARIVEAYDAQQRRRTRNQPDPES